jgi:hypothetical protein
VCFAQRQKFDKQDQSFFCFFVFAIGVLYCSKVSFERRKKVGDMFFLGLQLKSFHCSRVSFERRKESG